MNTFRMLTRAEMASLPTHVKAARIEHWRSIVAALEDDHWRRYPDALRTRRSDRGQLFPIYKSPPEGFDGVGATLARGFRESA